MSRYERQQRAARRKEDRRDDEGCCAGAMDTCTHPCCAGFTTTALLMTLVGPASAARGTRHDDPVAPRPRGRVAGRMYDAVRHYRTEVSPTVPARCPYTPTCSTYAVQALHRHGARRGARLVVARLLRCRPGAARRRGYRDPVPE